MGLTTTPTPAPSGAREVHIGCCGTVVLRHETWQCLKCKRRPISVMDTKTVYEERTEP